MPGRRRDRRRRHLGQGGGAIFERKPRRQGLPEIVAIERFRRRPVEIWICQKTARHAPPKRRRRERARRRDRPRRRCAGAPNRRSARCRVRCRRRGSPPPSPIQVTFATPPMLSTASGFGSAAASAAWNSGASGAPSPPAATSAERKSATTSNAEPARQQRAVADLPGAPFGRAMQDRVTVKADHLDRGLSDAGARNCSTASACSRVSSASTSRDRTDAAEHRAQPLAELRRIGEGQRRARDHPVAAVGLDHRDIDAVERGAAHQPDRTPHARGECCGPARAPMLDDAAMSTPRSPFLATALERGFIHQCTDMEALDERLRGGPRCSLCRL